MAFEDISCVSKARSTRPKVPASGVTVAPRRLGLRGGQSVRYIRIEIGPVLARGIALTQPEHGLRLLFGTGSDAGKIQVSVDNEAGKFIAKRSKSGSYATTINSATAEGLFALSFDSFSDPSCEAMRPQNGKPPYFVFKASAGMLAAEA